MNAFADYEEDIIISITRLRQFPLDIWLNADASDGVQLESIFYVTKHPLSEPAAVINFIEHVRSRYPRCQILLTADIAATIHIPEELLHPAAK